LDDVEAVAALAGTCARDEVLGLLDALSEQSLVERHAKNGAVLRHRLLEPIAQYARGRLDAAGEWEAASIAHATHFLALAEEAAPRYQHAEQVQWLARVDAEHPNLMAASERSLAAGHVEVSARFGWALWMYWWLRGHLVPGHRHMEAVLVNDLPADIRARAELAAATMAFAMDDIETSRRWWRAAEQRSAGTPDLVSHANAVAGVGLSLLADGDVDGAEDCFRRTAPIAEAAGPAGEWTAALNQIWLGTVALLKGNPDQAVEHIERGHASARGRGDRLTTYVALFNLAQVEAARERLDLARRHLEDGMRLSLETGDHANLAYFLDALAVVEAADGRHARVPILTGAAQGIRENIGARGYGYYRPDPAAGVQAAEEARRHLGSDRYDDALDVGRGLSPRDAVALALGERTRAS
jgi:tetratricopeptide (TPR) repeat protein